MTFTITQLIITTNLSVQLTSILFHISVPIQPNFNKNFVQLFTDIDSQGQLEHSQSTPPQAPLHCDASFPAGDSSLQPGSDHFQVTQPPSLNYELICQRGDRHDCTMGAQGDSHLCHEMELKTIQGSFYLRRENAEKMFSAIKTLIFFVE